MPLTYAGRVNAELPVSEARERARKIKPQYTHGALQAVATASHQAEAEFIQMLLLEEGVPSTVRRTTWDVPEMLAAGPREVLVPESGYELAREILRSAEIETKEGVLPATGPSPLRLLAGITIALAIVGLVLALARVPG